MSGRVKLNLRVSREAKREFEAAIRDEHSAINGKNDSLRPYAGVRLEDELRTRLDEGRLADVWRTVTEVAEVHGIDPREKNSTGGPWRRRNGCRELPGGRGRARAYHVIRTI